MKHQWDVRYTSEKYVYGVSPNGFFRKQIAKYPPGRILLPGEGEGRNAVYAAHLGWEVMAIDQSTVGREKALRLAEGMNVKIRYEVMDVMDMNFPEASFDAIGLFFLHMTPVLRRRFHHQLVRLLRPGGVVMAESFHIDQLTLTSGGPKNPVMLYTREILADDFNTLDIQCLEEASVFLDEGLGHYGDAAVVRLIAKK